MTAEFADGGAPMDADEQRVIRIPRKDDQENFRSIKVDGRTEIDEVLLPLIDENASLAVWIKAISAFARRSEPPTLLRDAREEAGDGDRLRELDRCAAFCVDGVRVAAEKRTADRLAAKAAEFLAMGDEINRFDAHHLLVHVFFALSVRQFEKAETWLQFVLDGQPADPRVFTPALIAKGLIACAREEWAASLQWFRACLQKNPDCPPMVRLYIGFCLSKLGDVRKAKIAFDRTLELDSNNTETLVALAVLCATQPATPEEAEFGLQTLAAVYRADPKNPTVLNHLANHFFCKSLFGEPNDRPARLEKAKKLAQKAVSLKANAQTAAESHFHLARVLHSTGNVEEAQQHYAHARRLRPFFLPATFGFAQTALLLGNSSTAASLLKELLEKAPKNVDVLKFAAALFVRAAAHDELAAEQRAKAVECLERAVRLQPDDPIAALELASALQTANPLKALRIFRKAVGRLDDQQTGFLSTVWNQIGVLEYANEDFKAARNAFEKARSLLVAGGFTNERQKALMITSTFNLARTLERMGREQQAEAIYTALQRKLPDYTDAAVRLGCLAFKKGHFDAALGIFNRLLWAERQNPDWWTLLGVAYLQLGQLGPSQEHFNAACGLPDGWKNPLVWVGVGCVWLERSVREPFGTAAHLSEAGKHFRSALQVDPRCLPAVQGLGCVFAYHGRFADAAHVFHELRACAPNSAEVWLNLANVRADGGDFGHAAATFETIAHQFANEVDDELCTNAAFSFFRDGQHQRALDWLDRVVSNNPLAVDARFNHAFVSMHFAEDVLAEAKSTAEELQRSIDVLEASQKIFTEISQMPAVFAFLSRTTCGKLAAVCGDLVRQAGHFLGAAMRKEAKEREDRARFFEQRHAKDLIAHKEAAAELELKLLQSEERKIQRKLMLLKRTSTETPEEQKELLRKTSGGKKRRSKENAASAEGTTPVRKKKKAVKRPKKTSEKKEKKPAARRTRKKKEATVRVPKTAEFVEDSDSETEETEQKAA